jgi:hypothetical protein
MKTAAFFLVLVVANTADLAPAALPSLVIHSYWLLVP